MYLVSSVSERTRNHHSRAFSLSLAPPSSLPSCLTLSFSVSLLSLGSLLSTMYEDESR